jgi:hypothetical protein
LCQFWLKLAEWFLRKRFLNDSIPFLHFCDYLPFEESLALYFNNLEFPSPKDNLYQVWFNLACWMEKIFLRIQCIFTLSLLSPLKEGLSSFFKQTWIPLAQGCFVSSLVKIGPVVLEKKIFKWPTPFLHCCDYLLFEEDLALYLNKIEFPSLKDNLYQVWLNLDCWFWRRFFKIFSIFLLFRYYLPLEKGYPLLLNKPETPWPKDDLC